MKHSSIFVGRGDHKNAFLQRLHDVGVSQRSKVRALLHYSGPQAIGKTSVVRAIPTWVRSLETAGLVAVDLSDPKTFDFFEKLLDIRSTARKVYPGFNTEAFDFAALLFDLKFRNGVHTSHALKGTTWSHSSLIESSLEDAIKEGAKKVVEDFQTAGLSSVVGGALGAGAAVTLSAPALATALTAAAFTGVSVGAVLMGKHLLTGAIKAVKKHNLIRDNPTLKQLLDSESTYDDFQDALAQLLAEAFEAFAAKSRTSIFCFTLDPADRLAGQRAKYPGRELGRILFAFFAEVPGALVSTTSRAPCSDWRKHALPASCTGHFKIEEKALLPLPVDAVLHDLAEQLAVSAEQVRRELGALASGTHIDPAKLHDWLNSKPFFSQLRAGAS